jgi:hypothetical protein
MSTNIIEHYYNYESPNVDTCGSPHNGEYKKLRQEHFTKTFGEFTETSDPIKLSENKKNIQKMLDINQVSFLEVIDQVYANKKIHERIQKNIKVLDSNRYKINESKDDNLMREYRVKNSEKNKQINNIKYVVFIVLIVIFLIVELIILVI